MGTKRTRRLACVLGVFLSLGEAVLLLWMPAEAHGQDRIANRAAAEALFDQGRALMASGKYEEACPKFAESQRLDAGVGTLLNLAECLEKTGRTASAWVEFRAAAAAARDAGQVDRERVARERAAMLKPRLASLTIALAPGQTRYGIRIKRNGETVEPTLWGMPLPVDPGTHTVEVSAPGKKTWAAAVEIPRKAGAKITLTVPILEDAPADAHSGADPKRTVAYVAGGAGALGIGLGAAFGIAAIMKNDESKAHCRVGNLCTARGVTLRSEALAAGTGSTVAFVVGGLALAGGTVLYLTSRDSSPSAPPVPKLHVGVAPVGPKGLGIGLVARGSF